MKSTFTEASKNFPKEIGSSASIFCCFLQLLNFITPSDVNFFFDETKISQHFFWKNKEFINHISDLSVLLLLIPETRLRIILVGLFEGVSESYDRIFASYIADVINVSPTIFFGDLFSFSFPENREIILVSILARLEDSFNYLNETQTQFILKVSLSIISGPNPITNQFEDSCIIIAKILKNKIQIPELDQILNQKFPSHLQKLTYLLPTPLENLFFDETDSQTLKIAKIRGLKWQTISPEIITLLQDALEMKSEIRTTTLSIVSEFVTFKPNVLLVPILNRILDIPSENWLQNKMKFELFSKLSIDWCIEKMTNFIPQIIDLIFLEIFSTKSDLSLIALSTLVIFSAPITIDSIIQRFVQKDLFDPNTFLAFINFLNEVKFLYQHQSIIKLNSQISEFVLFHMDYFITLKSLIYLSSINYTPSQSFQFCCVISFRIVLLFN